MSSFKKINNNANKTSNSNVVKNPFCKVCFDAKRAGYDSHFLKADGLSSGVVVCPYLLSLECKYCKKPGHTVSYCDVLAAKNEYQNTQQTQPQQMRAKLHQDLDGWVTKSSSRNSQEGRFYIKGMAQAHAQIQTQTQTRSAPKIMFDDDDKEEEQTSIVVEKTPQPMGEWAAIAAKKPVQKTTLRITTDMLFQGAKKAHKKTTDKLATTDKTIETEKQAVTPASSWKQMVLTSNWADDSDDDE